MSAHPFAAVVIGVSAGAMDALTVILPKLPRHFPPVMVVVHIPPDKKSLLADLFAVRCQMAVKEAEDKEEIKKGTIYFAPPAYHLLVETNYTLSLSTEEPLLFSRPSIDVLFETAADAYEDKLVGIILTGANSDGAHGLREVEKRGGTAIVQKPDSSYATAMPDAAIASCPQATILGLEQIADYLMKADAL